MKYIYFYLSFWDFSCQSLLQDMYLHIVHMQSMKHLLLGSDLHWIPYTVYSLESLAQVRYYFQFFFNI